MCVSKTNDHIIIKIKIPNTSQEPLTSSKAHNENLKDMNVLQTFKINRDSHNLEHECIKDHWQYLNQDHDVKHNSGISNVLEIPKWGLKGHQCFLHFQIQDVKPKFGSLVSQRPLTISKTRSRCQTPVRNLQHPPKLPNVDWKDMDVLCAFTIKIKSQNLDHRYIKDQWPYSNQDQDAKPQSGTSIIL